ncbi:SMI1/KNR4 family protein [Kitasatospora sp. NPDC001540]|uniref:SMI1/KNR4 family protein n=1 Tax=Kitasatospora sp. NPDC001540 TaxID=3364014 RepID=UPI0036BFD705
MTGNARGAEIADSGVDWSGVREQVLALRDAPFAGEVFGARWQGFGHDFPVEPPLSETDLAEAEKELGVSLPPDYRTFLLEVGAGGAGSFYGAFPLRRDEQGWHWLDGKVRSDNTLLREAVPFHGGAGSLGGGTRRSRARQGPLL